MNRKTATITLALPLGVLIGSLGPRWTDEAPTAAQPDLAPVLGVVDLDAVRQGYPKARELREAWIAEKGVVEARLAEGAKGLQKLKLEAEAWDALSEEWITAQAKLRAMDAELTQIKELEERRLLLRQMRVQEELYEDIDRAVTELAKKKKLQIVLRMTPNVPESESIDNRIALWSTRNVLYSSESLDLTQDVINFLKSPDFAGNGAAKPQNDK